MLRSMLSVNPARGDFFQFVVDHVDPGSPTVICGDFNTVLERARHWCGFTPDVSPQDSSGALTSLFWNSCVVDVWLSLDGKFSSWIHLVGCPIPWLHHVRACDIIPCPYSDHVASHPLWTTPGRWIFNTSLLKEPA